MAQASSGGAAALILGGTRGIGRATAVRLAAGGRFVGIVGRDRDAGAEVVRTITAQGGRGAFLQADLSSMHAVADLAGKARARLGKLSVLVHSADVLRRQRQDSGDGVEISFATNYLSRFLLNRLLLDDLVAAAPARIVHVAAAGFPGALDTGDVPPPPRMSSFAGHSVGQRANDVYTVELARRLQGTGVSITTINPGSVDTDIRRNAPDGGRVLAVMAAVSRPWTTSAEVFAEQVVRLAVSDEVDGVTGALFNRRGRLIKPRWGAAEPERGSALWRRSEALVQPFLPTGQTAAGSA